MAAWREAVKHAESLNPVVVELLDAIQEALPIEGSELNDLVIGAWLRDAEQRGLIKMSEHMRIRNTLVHHF